MKSRLLILTLVAAVAGLAALAGVSSAAVFNSAKATTVSSDLSSNWAGYVVDGQDDYGDATTYKTVSGTWVQPTAKCSTSTSGSTASAFWVGIGGNSQNSDALEQTGTEADCSATGVAKYSAWSELVPKASVKVALAVAAGDTVAGAVTVDGTKITVSLDDKTSGKNFSKTLFMASPDTTSAEWIAEAPSDCSSAGRCSTVTLTNFGKVKFTKASATTTAGHTGSITDPAFTATAIKLAADGSASGDPFGQFGAEASSRTAAPSALTGGGSDFTVTWKQSASSASSSTGGYGGYGYGGGYGGGGYGGYGGGGGYYSSY